jgi:hypothetical protein
MLPLFLFQVGSLRPLLTLRSCIPSLVPPASFSANLTYPALASPRRFPHGGTLPDCAAFTAEKYHIYIKKQKTKKKQIKQKNLMCSMRAF